VAADRQHGVSAEAALEAGLQEKAHEFRAGGDRVYLPLGD
jgi:hypothetical protein